MRLAKLIDGRISIPEQLLRGGRRTDRTASDDAKGTEKEATGTSEARLRDGIFPIADLEPQSIDDRDHSHWDALLKTAPTDLVLLPIGSLTANLLSRTAEWVPLYKDTCCVLFVREGFPGLGPILQSPIPSLPDNGAGLCFPTPGRVDRGVIR